MRVLILGGYGTFGARLARLLAAEPGLSLVIAGRDGAKARALAARLGGGASGLALDRDAPLEPRLAPLGLTALVDASGPFQDYGPRPYRVAEACLALGLHYLDLADARAFVQGIDRLDAAARARGVALLSGLSTLPALSQAAVRALTLPLALPLALAAETVTVGVAPSPFAGIGLAVVRAAAGYAGRRLEGGHALIDARVLTVAPPGHLPLRPRRFLLCEVPDEGLVPGARVWAGAGMEPAPLARLLSWAAWLPRLGLLPSLAPFARLFHGVLGRLRWGERRGGMLVAVAGRDAAGQERRRSWHLLAEGDSGPNVPALAAAALLRRLARGQAPAPGARAATAELELADFAPWFQQLGIVTGVREEAPADPVFRQVLGSAFDRLPPSLRRLHGGERRARFQGRATVERGRGLGGLLAGLLRLPRSGRDLPLTVTIEAGPDGERWQRDFAGQRFHSRLGAGRGCERHLLVERFGPVSLAIALVLAEGRLAYVIRGWRLGPLPLPRCLAPRGATFESEAADGRFQFEVAIRLPLLGLLARYRGWLAA